MAQILKFMSPAELLALRDVNKGFRSTLDSGKKASLIWVNSRGLVPCHGIPNDFGIPFENFDECAWVRMFKEHTPCTDFSLMMRLCSECRRENLCQGLDFSAESDEEDFMGPVVKFDNIYPHSKWHQLWVPNYTSHSATVLIATISLTS
ncbi:hypothetical protein C8R44DRAFT_873463 [Mycena epipterygia]|nr:hypothetical protein C8R44DRAFT_873463 [Mycena epipterygia]